MRKLSKALEQTADVVIITNPQGVIEWTNAAFEAFVQRPRLQLLASPARLASRASFS